MARVYVGTYKKYNEGSIAGGWLDLANYKTYDEFLAACRKLHKGEHDPEFMIQDSEGFPDGLDCMEWISRQEFDDVKKAIQDEREEEDRQRPNISIVDYSDRSIAVIGDTRQVKAELKRLGGRFNGKLSCGAGWIFPASLRSSVEAFIASGVATETDRKKGGEGAKFVGWLDDFVNSLSSDFDKDYYRKENVGAVKLRGGYFLIEKQSIENRFCFHDEGPDDELHRQLCRDENLMRDYFLRHNLSWYDNKLEAINKGEDIYIGTEAFKNNTVEICFNSSFYTRNNSWLLCTDEERKLLAEGLTYGKNLFKKRLDSYLKRWGTSKIHTWSYWADA